MKIELNQKYKLDGTTVKVMHLNPCVVLDENGEFYDVAEEKLKPIAPECPVEMLPLPEGAVYLGQCGYDECELKSRWAAAQRKVWNDANIEYPEEGGFEMTSTKVHYCAEIDSEAHRAMEWYEPQKSVVRSEIMRKLDAEEKIGFSIPVPSKAKAANNNFPAVGTKLRFKVDYVIEKAGTVCDVVSLNDSDFGTTSIDGRVWLFGEDWKDLLEVVPSLKLEVGKYYKNRRGEVVGPLEKPDLKLFKLRGKRMFYPDGGVSGCFDSEKDLVAEANLPPIGTLLRSKKFGTTETVVEPMDFNEDWEKDFEVVVIPELPEGVSDPGDAWIYAGDQPIQGADGNPTDDIAMWVYPAKRWHYTLNQGTNHYHYALRRGSPIHRQQVWFSEDQVLKKEDPVLIPTLGEMVKDLWLALPKNQKPRTNGWTLLNPHVNAKIEDVVEKSH